MTTPVLAALSTYVDDFSDITLSDSGRLGVMQWPEPGLRLNFG